jgi:hypothetical protein
MAGTTHSLPTQYAVHADGNTSYFRRWNKDHRQPLCEFGETVQYLLPTNKQLPKMEQRFYPAIWLGRDTTTGETLLGIANRVVRARTIRRMPRPEKYNKQLFDVISKTNTQQLPTAGQALLNQPMAFHPPPRRSTAHTETQTAAAEEQATAATHSAARGDLRLPSPSSTEKHQRSEDDNASDRRRTTRNFANQLSHQTSNANTTAKANRR